MTRAQRRAGLLVIAGLAVLVIAVAIVAIPIIVQTTISADYAGLPEGTEVVMTKEQSEMMGRAEGFSFWGPALLVSVAALLVAIVVVALRWPKKRSADPSGV
jgi:hypothetical protein